MPLGFSVAQRIRKLACHSNPKIQITDIAASLPQGTTETTPGSSQEHSLDKTVQKVNMHFNSNKFECFWFGPGNGEPPAFQYLGPHKNDIEIKTDLKDLVVQISFRFASQLYRWSLRFFKMRRKSIMKSIWSYLIQPKIDYCPLGTKYKSIS